MKPTILVVDDDAAFRRLVVDILSDGDYRILQAPNAEQALALFANTSVDLLLTDQQMPGLSGLELIRRVRSAANAPAVVMMTAFGTIPQAVEAVSLGATDYLTKPLESPAALRALVRRLLGERAEATHGSRAFLTRDPATLEMLALADRAAATDATVLITGDSGTGKELIAQRIHNASPRSAGPFVAVNCAAIPGNLAESELFGHEKGAFTSADARRIGRFEQANGGTLFLDEIGELPEGVQAKLLRVLEERHIERVGGHESIPVTLRLVAATNRRLDQDVEAGRFRSDLYYRLNVMHLALSPLRERPGDLELLVPALIKPLAARLGVAPRPVKPQAMARLKAHSWPGNVRELRNALERALIVSSESGIDAADLPPLDGRADAATDLSEGAGLSLQERERQAILEALKSAAGHREKAAEMLGISVRTLYNRLRQYDLR